MMPSGDLCQSDSNVWRSFAVHRKIATPSARCTPQGEAEKHGAGSCPIEPAISRRAAKQPSYVQTPRRMTLELTWTALPHT